MEYRRLFQPGGTYFFTVVTYQRRPIFSSPQAVKLLRDAFRYTLERLPFIIVASVILPDHMHFIWTLPVECSDFSTRWKMIKSYFTKNWRSKGVVSKSISRRRKGEADVWQRRFWEHLIRDERDFANHIEYIHNNPVKHGLAKSPAEWQYSSFMKYVRDGMYDVNWNVEVAGAGFRAEEYGE